MLLKIILNTISLEIIMKKLSIFTSLFALLMLVSCSSNPGGNEPSPSPTPTPTPTPVGPSHIDQSFNFKILSSNDIHGQVEEENISSYSGRAGIGKFFTYAKHVKETNPYTLLFDQGDTFQGSIYSNENRGELITKAMAYAHYDARAIGNHDFDWGVEPLRNLKDAGYGDYTVPTLGANIYNYDFNNKSFLPTHRDDFCDKTTICSFSNGFKVGVIGTIGSNQIKDILTSNVMDLNFKNHINVIKQEAKDLKEQGCHFIVSLHHGNIAELMGNGLEKYIDLGLCGHSHTEESDSEGNTHYFQFACYTEIMGELNFSFNASTQKVSFSSSSSKRASDIESAGYGVDSVISGLINEAKEDIETRMNPDQVVASNVNGNFYSTSTAANLVAKAMYDTAISEGYNVDLAYCNQLRHTLYSPSWTFSDIYQAAPFDNRVYIVDVPYEEVSSEIKAWNNICKQNGRTINLSPGQTLKVACLDFLLFHASNYRYFDYFPSIGPYFNDRDNKPQLSKNYRDTLKDWLISKGYSTGKQLKANDYTSSVSDFNKDEIVLS